MPNLFIIGAPKCGTTALSGYLAGHPEVYMSEQAGNKEPEYFADDFRFGWTAVSGREDYLSLFLNAPRHMRYLGEASVSYLHSKVAVPAILRCSPEAKFIVMIRNPVEIAQRLHNQHVKHSLESVLEFERAWELQRARLDGKYLPVRFQDGRGLQYGELAKIGEQMYRLFSAAPKDQIHVIVYDDFVRAPAAEYEAVNRFLGIASDGRASFPVVNPSVSYRVDMVQRALMWLRGYRERLGLPGGLGIHKAIDRINAKVGPKPLDPRFRQKLNEYYRHDIDILSRLLGRDFSVWLQ